MVVLQSFVTLVIHLIQFALVTIIKALPIELFRKISLVLCVDKDMIETGLKKLDQFLGGGIKEGLITDISGQNSTGKTQLAFQICINALKNGKEILFQDTTGEFRPERLVEMLKIRKLDPILLDKIKVGRITNSIQQLEYLSKITTNRLFLDCNR